ncbi:MAG TPA: hypothetical protein VNX25_08425, partial [Verrucomicrobiae bacterium]|nr:hypothetical protein [Verrucomicrobiae bacterium]
MADGLLLRIDPAVRESLPPQLAAAGAALAAGCTEDEAAELADDLPLLYYHLARLESRGLVSRVLRVGAGEAAELLPLVPGARFPDTMPAFSTLRLSRFALLRREGDFPVLESPRSPFRLLVRDGKLLPLLAQLAQETAPGDFSASCAAAGLSDEGAAALLRLL